MNKQKRELKLIASGSSFLGGVKQRGSNPKVFWFGGVMFACILDLVALRFLLIPPLFYCLWEPRYLKYTKYMYMDVFMLVHSRTRIYICTNKSPQWGSNPAIFVSAGTNPHHHIYQSPLVLPNTLQFVVLYHSAILSARDIMSRSDILRVQPRSHPQRRSLFACVGRDCPRRRGQHFSG